MSERQAGYYTNSTILSGEKENIMSNIETNNTAMAKKTFTTKYMVELAAMIAIIIIMAFTPLGYIKLPGLTITFLTIPVAVGAIILGPVGGLICGLTFGLTSLYQAVTGGSVFTFALFNLNPVFTIILTIVPRALEGLLTGLIFKALHNIKSVQKISYYIASLCCPLLNTLLFMSTLVALFYRTDFIQTYVAKFGVGNPFSFVVAFVGTQGAIEAVVCFVVASILARTLYAVLVKNS
mgnify:FL=1|jgi:uncharacterized membrane protein